MRTVLSILAGFLVWSALWLSSNAALAAALPGSFDADGLTSSAGILLVILASSVLFSIAAGYFTATLSQQKAKRDVFVLACIQLAIGIAVQSQYWSVMPLWYHLSFLGLLVPGHVLGGRLRVERRVRLSTGSPETSGKA